MSLGDGFTYHGQRLQRFSVEALLEATHAWQDVIGSGSTGRVYRGTLPLGKGDLIAPTSVAVKRLHLGFGASPEHAQYVERAFHAEVETLSGLQHLNIVRLLGYTRGNDPRSGEQCSALVFELLEGGSLASRLKAPGIIGAQPSHPLGAAARLATAIGVARGLAYLHGTLEEGDTPGAPRAPTLHRDIKAANIGLDAEGTPKLLDCGLARAMRGGGAATTPTLTPPLLQSVTGGTLLGTPGYAAPEVARGRYGVASEVFSLGVVLFELFTGALVTQDTLAEARNGVEDEGLGYMHALAETAVWPPILVAPLAALVMECTEPRAERRPPSARAVLERLLALRPTIATLVPPLRKCLVCMDEFEASEGLACNPPPPAAIAGGGGGGAAAAAAAAPTPAAVGGGKDGHFICQGCLQPYVLSRLEPSMLRKSRGCVACPGFPSGCTAPPWDFAALRTQLSGDTVVAYVHTLSQFMGVLLDSEAGAAAAREAALKARADAVAAALALAERKQRVAALRTELLQEYLNLRCPRCHAPFAEYDGCDALTCQRCGAGFCGLCLKDCGTDAHQHVAQTNHAKMGPNLRVHASVDAKRTHHASLRARAIIQAVGALAVDQGMKHDVIQAMRKDLGDVGVNTDAVLREVGVAVIVAAREGGGGGGGGGDARGAGGARDTGGGRQNALPPPPPADQAGGAFASFPDRHAATDCLSDPMCTERGCPFRHVDHYRVFCGDWVAFRDAGEPFCPRGPACPWAHPHHTVVGLTDCPLCPDGIRGGHGTPCAYTGGLPSLLRHKRAPVAGLPGLRGRTLCRAFDPPGSRCPRGRECDEAHVMSPQQPGDGGYPF